MKVAKNPEKLYQEVCKLRWSKFLLKSSTSVSNSHNTPVQNEGRLLLALAGGKELTKRQDSCQKKCSVYRARPICCMQLESKILFNSSSLQEDRLWHCHLMILAMLQSLLLRHFAAETAPELTSSDCNCAVPLSSRGRALIAGTMPLSQSLMKPSCRFKEAIPLLEQVVKAAPTLGDSYQTLGLCFEHTDDRRKALDCYLIYAHMHPKVGLHILYFMSFSLQPNLEVALRCFHRRSDITQLYCQNLTKRLHHIRCYIAESYNVSTLGFASLDQLFCRI